MSHSSAHFSLEYFIHRCLHTHILPIPFTSFFLRLANSAICPHSASRLTYFRKLLAHIGPFPSQNSLKLAVQYVLLFTSIFNFAFAMSHLSNDTLEGHYCTPLYLLSRAPRRRDSIDHLFPSFLFFVTWNQANIIILIKLYFMVLLFIRKKALFLQHYSLWDKNLPSPSLK